MDDSIESVLEAHGGLPPPRRAFVRGPDSRPVRDLLMVAIDPSDYRLT